MPETIAKAPPEIPHEIPAEYADLFRYIKSIWFSHSKISVGRQLTDGYSGAFVSVIDVYPSDQKDQSGSELAGTYILKLQRDDSPATTASETQRHKVAYDWNESFSRSHLLPLVRSDVLEDYSALLYEVAGSGLTTVTSAETMDAASLERYMQLVSNALLSELNENIQVKPHLTGEAILKQWLGERLDPARAPMLHKSSKTMLGEEASCVVVDEVLVNPLWLSTSHVAQQEPSPTALFGLLHGDVHLRNLLLDRISDNSDSWWLIDFAHSKEGPIGYDHCYLELSLMLHHLGGLGPERMIGVLRALDAPVETRLAGRVPLHDSGLVHSVRALRNGVVKWQSTSQPRRPEGVHAQFQLARIAAGLNWANKRNLSDKDHLLALVYAAWAARAYLRRFFPESWDEIVTEPRDAAVAATSRKQIELNDLAETWERLWQQLKGFDSVNSKYVLVTGQLGVDENNASLGLLPWSAIIDFDAYSNDRGLHAVVHRLLAKTRAIEQFGLEPLPSNFERGTAWLMACGWPKINEPIPLDITHWARTYRKTVRSLSELIRKAATPQQVHVVILATEPLSGDYLRRTVETLDEELGDIGRFVIIGQGQMPERAAAYKHFPISASQFTSKLRQMYGISDETGAASIPGPDAQRRLIPVEMLPHLEQDLEILHSRVLAVSACNSAMSDAFWKGNAPSWSDIQEGRDVQRAILPALLNAVKEPLLKSRNFTVELHHSPGAGGTTVAMRLAWELKDEYPVAFLRQASILTLDRLRDLFTLAQHPILLIVDGPILTDVGREQLYHGLLESNARVVILHVLRTTRIEKDRPLVVSDPMSRKEARAFLEDFEGRPEITSSPEKRHFLSKIASSHDGDSNSRYRSPFFFGLTTYGREFTSVERYVREYLLGLPPDLKQPMKYLGLVSRFSQLDMHVSIIASMIRLIRPELPEDADVLLAFADAANLLIRREQWIKLLHPIVAEEVLRQIMNKPPTEANWGDELATLSISFIDTLLEAAGSDSQLAHQLLVQTFIYRDVWSTDMQGRTRNFAELIEAIGDKHSQHRILRRLTEVQPLEPHFWNHLGRHHIFKLKRDFKTAEDYLLRAVSLAPEDAYHHHSLGMVRRFWVGDILRGAFMKAASSERKGATSGSPKPEELINLVQDIADKAFDEFTEARRLNPNDEHGYVTHIQLILSIAEALFRAAGAQAIASMSRQGPRVNAWLRNQMVIAEGLLAEIQHMRAETKASRYEVDIVGRLARVWGDFKAVIRSWEEEVDTGRDNTFVRRALVTAYLASNRRDWAKVPQNQLQRIVDLMESNLLDDPGNERDMRIWFDAYRRVPQFSYLDAISRLGSWARSAEALDAYYYLYVLHFLLVRQKIERNEDEVIGALSECRKHARGRRVYSYMWLGAAPEWCPLLHFSQLGEWSPKEDFYPNSALLVRVQGTIKSIDGPQAGQIRLGPKLTAFFVPKTSFSRAGGKVNTEVDFFLGFSYDGFRAFSVELIANTDSANSVGSENPGNRNPSK